METIFHNAKIKRFWFSDSGKLYLSLFDDSDQSYLVPRDVCRSLQDFFCRYLPVTLRYVQMDGYRKLTWFSLVKVYLFERDSDGRRTKPVPFLHRTLLDFYQTTTIPKTNYQKFSVISQREWDAANDGSVPPAEACESEDKRRKLAEKRKLNAIYSKPPRALQR